jgi:peptidoglycan/xylan/chitin deacetylase (PgdA/CDA1 family)
LFSALSGQGPDARLTILIFHRVLAEPDALLEGEVDAKRFNLICSWLARWFRVLPLDEAMTRLRAGTLPSRSLCITFDDGYADNHDVALPILRSHGLPATFFVTTGVIDGGLMWNDTVIESVRRAEVDQIDGRDLGLGSLGVLSLIGATHRRLAIERLLLAIKHLEPDERSDRVERLRRLVGLRELRSDLMMTVEQVCGLRNAGMQIGGHTVTHPILARLDDATARHEIAEGKRVLEAWLGEEVSMFAYPNGRPGDDFEPKHAVMAREAGFKAALTTAWGVATRETDAYVVPRFTPWAPQRWKFGLQLARNLASGRRGSASAM